MQGDYAPASGDGGMRAIDLLQQRGCEPAAASPGGSCDRVSAPGGTGAGSYEAANRVEGELERSYGNVDRPLHCAPEEIALQENATPAWEMAGATPGNSSTPIRNVKAVRPRSCFGYVLP
jgi:hypothetical protein